MIVDDINEIFPCQTFTFTMDNPNVHKNMLVIGLILNGGQQVVFRAQYGWWTLLLNLPLI